MFNCVFIYVYSSFCTIDYINSDQIRNLMSIESVNIRYELHTKMYRI